ncbi:type II secretion system protein [Glaciimonas sp. CA11.2]|uniref:type II secretion system protein n=1 Tax=unclassified Glaciimonas TaxID=2644401 RepID=UPI002AB57CBE|nr:MULTISPECIES: type II secretion system protein [unclassified Glaciimonas]MDY7545099.1 type II secretion system protein [Glaciimonas sp. CA11.2]MEB0011431.1 type II secretion system protein [Glaciimonas sp. Cout2]MEB0081082.1 type II secretion system protein [Glaciimonas sp. Gout2]MEB0162414.1 type II secretion system protein [Glaciimonas sp. CA11.2]
MKRVPSIPAYSRNKAFTLIEMVIVMALIGLLLTLAVPRYFTALENGKIKVQQQNLASIRDAIDKFYGDQGHYPETLDTLVQSRYLRSVPIDPLTEKSNWTIVAPVDTVSSREPNPATGTDANGNSGGISGVYDVHSAAEVSDAK